MVAQPMTEAWPALIVLPAEIDITNARDVRSQILGAAMRPGVRIIIADLSATEFCDTSGVRELVLAHQRAVRDGNELRLLRPCVNVMRVLQVLGLAQKLTICQSLEDAIMP